jgi:hypothetical protein
VATTINKTLTQAALLKMYPPPGATDYGPVMHGISDEDLCHPMMKPVQTLLAGLSVADVTAVLNFRLKWLQGKQTAAQNALKALNAAWGTLPAQVKQANVQAAAWPFSGWNYSRRKLQWRMDLAQSIGITTTDPECTDTADASAVLVSQSVATEAADPVKATYLLLQMRCAADVYGRWEVGATLAQQLLGAQTTTAPLSAAQMLARILAFWRTEGDMSLPPEFDTLGRPNSSSDTPAGTTAVGLVPGRLRWDYIVVPKPHMYCCTWLAQALPSVPLPNGGTVDMTVPATQYLWADSSFMVCIAGLDILFNPDMRSAAEYPNTFPNAIDWQTLNYGIAAAATAANDRRGKLLTTQTFPGTNYVRLAPLGAADYKTLDAATYSGANVEYASLVVGESIRYLNRLTAGATRFSAAAAARVPEALVYLLYHTGGQSRIMLASAVANAVKRPSSAVAKQLLAALPSNYTDSTDPIYKSLMKIRNASTADAAQPEADSQWTANFADDFGAQDALDALDAYVRGVGDSEWKAWRVQRRNVTAYYNLYKYYLGIIDPASPP